MDKIDILGVKLDNHLLCEWLEIWEGVIKKRSRPAYVCFCEANLCVRAYREPDVMKLMDAADFILPDGVAMTAGAMVTGQHFHERQPGPNTMQAFCRFGESRNIRHFFYGGQDETHMKKMITALRSIVPDIKIAGWYVPPFQPLTDQENLDVTRQINTSGADVLWIGLGAPKQERWMHEHQEVLNVPLMFGVGAAFDFLAGTRKRAPRWIQKIGAEWIYRMFTGGRRVFLRNLTQESSFVFLIFMQAIRNTLGKRTR